MQTEKAMKFSLKKWQMQMIIARKKTNKQTNKQTKKQQQQQQNRQIK